MPALKNIIKFGWENFTRSKGLNLPVIFIMAVMIFAATSLFLARGLSDFLIEEFEKQVDVSVFFKKDAKEENILQIRDELRKLSSEIEEVDYIPREMALERFQQGHFDEPVLLEALDELQDNPFSAHLNITAISPEYYANISSFLQDARFNDVVEKISYNKSRQTIERLIAATSFVNRGGIFASSFLAVLVVIIIFNIVKLSITIFKEEITAMRLVGASNWFIRGPFLLHNILCGILAVLMVDILLFLGLLYFNIKLGHWLGSFNLLNYFQEHLLLIICGQMLLIILLGSFSTLFALKKYLKK